MSTLNQSPLSPQDHMALTRAMDAVANAAHRVVPVAGAERLHPWAGQYDPGTLPAGVMTALMTLARAIGYSVQFRQEDGLDALGFTHGPHLPDLPGQGRELEPFTIYLLPGMSETSTARTLCHELGHAILGHTGRNVQEGVAAARRRYERLHFTGSPEDPEQECACELAAGTVALLAGIGTGQFSPAFLRDRARGMTGRARRDAMNVTRVIWQAIAPALEERQVAA